MLCRAQSISFSMFPSIPHSLAPLNILEQCIHGQSDPLYKVICCTEDRVALVLCRAQSILFSMFPSIPHSLAPLNILEQRIHSQSDPLYKVICHVEACTTGFSASRLPEPKAAWVVWAVSLSIETTQHVSAVL